MNLIQSLNNFIRRCYFFFISARDLSQLMLSLSWKIEMRGKSKKRYDHHKSDSSMPWPNLLQIIARVYNLLWQRSIADSRASISN